MYIEIIRNKVMDSKYSAYDIEKKTGISASNIYGLRSGRRDFNNLTFKTIKKLDEYFKNQK